MTTMTDPFAGKSEITSEEYRSFLDGRYPDFPPIAETAPAWQTSEKAFQAKVVKYATDHGWDVPYHTFNSASSQPGFPDLVFKRDGVVRFVAELKIPPNKTTKDQREWLDAFESAGVSAYEWTPDHMAVIERILA